MKILAIDSTAKTASAAVTEDERLIASFTLNGTLTHSQTLLPMVKAALEIAGLKVSDIDMFACSAGPGSFTGVRIGVSTIKGLAFGSGKPCVGVSTLDALARNLAIISDALIVPVMDARRSQVYNALFDGRKRLTCDRAIGLDELKTELFALSRPFYLVGDGYDLAHAALASPYLRETPDFLRCQNAYSVAASALALYKSAPDENYSDSSLSPVYLRPSQAERNAAENFIPQKGQ